MARASEKPEAEARRVIEDLAENISKLKDQLGATNEQLAAKVGSDQKTIGNIAKARHAGKIDTVALIARALTALGMNIKAWQLLVPGAWKLTPLERDELSRIVSAYVESPAMRSGLRSPLLLRDELAGAGTSPVRPGTRST